MAEAPLCIQSETGENGEWIPPPRGVKLSDEGVYLATKNMSAIDRRERFQIDFDKNGYIQAIRIPEDPTLLGWVYDPPIVIVERGIILLIGRKHAKKLGSLTLMGEIISWRLKPVVPIEELDG